MPSGPKKRLRAKRKKQGSPATDANSDRETETLSVTGSMDVDDTESGLDTPGRAGPRPSYLDKEAVSSQTDEWIRVSDFDVGTPTSQLGENEPIAEDGDIGSVRRSLDKLAEWETVSEEILPEKQEGSINSLEEEPSEVEVPSGHSSESYTHLPSPDPAGDKDTDIYGSDRIKRTDSSSSSSSSSSSRSRFEAQSPVPSPDTFHSCAPDSGEEVSSAPRRVSSAPRRVSPPLSADEKEASIADEEPDEKEIVHEPAATGSDEASVPAETESTADELNTAAEEETTPFEKPVAEEHEPFEQSREADEPAEQSREADEPAEQSREADEPAEQSREVDEPAEQPREADEPVEQSREVDELVEQSRAVDEPVEQSREVDEPVDQSRDVDEPVDQSREDGEPIEQLREDESVEQSREDDPIEQSREEDGPVEKSREEDEPVEQPREEVEPAEQSLEEDEPAEQPHELVDEEPAPHSAADETIAASSPEEEEEISHATKDIIEVNSPLDIPVTEETLHEDKEVVSIVEESIANENIPGDMEKVFISLVKDASEGEEAAPSDPLDVVDKEVDRDEKVESAAEDKEVASTSADSEDTKKNDVPDFEFAAVVEKRGSDPEEVTADTVLVKELPTSGTSEPLALVEERHLTLATPAEKSGIEKDKPPLEAKSFTGCCGVIYWLLGWND